MKNIYTILFCLVSVVISAQTTKFSEGVFRYAPWGHSLLADVHPNFIRLDVAYSSNRSEWDYDQSARQMRTNTFCVMGANIPLWRGDIKTEQYALSLTMPLSANIWLDLFEHITSPVVNTDYRIGLPVWTFLHRIDKGFARNYSVSFAPFKHESTHIGDEVALQHADHNLPLRRINVSYNYSEYIFTLNEAEDFRRQCHTFRVGLMLLWNWRKGWYFIDGKDGDAALARPRLSPWEIYLQYQYQSPVSKHGFQGVASFEIRNRALYGYPVQEWSEQNGVTYKLQDESRIFTYNMFLGFRFCNPKYDGYFSRMSLGIKAYHGNCPFGQFRNHRNYNQLGLCWIFE